jgi:hypothetical protein
MANAHFAGVRSSPRRVRRVMGENGWLADMRCHTFRATSTYPSARGWIGGSLVVIGLILERVIGGETCGADNAAAAAKAADSVKVRICTIRGFRGDGQRARRFSPSSPLDLAFATRAFWLEGAPDCDDQVRAIHPPLV